MTEAAAGDFVEIRFQSDQDGTGKLLVSAQASGFAGKSGAWFGEEKLAAFALLLTAFPLPIDPPPNVAGGFWRRDRPGELEEVLVRLEACRIGSLGQVALRVHLASEVWPPELPEGRHEVRLQLLTTYERLRHFGDEMLAVIRAETDHARVEGEVMAGSKGFAR